MEAERTSTTEILPPNTICTETYLLVSAFENEKEAQNLYKYLSTKFVRFLIGQSAIGQHITRASFRFVPMQNFTPSSDIDWSKSIPEIDAQLYKKYGLSDEEIEFIESMIKAME